MKSWDIFCHVVDNYGDIGVTWRLARQLSQEFDYPVRLFVDDLASFQHICPEVDQSANEQSVFGVVIIHWRSDLAITPSDIVIEAFACELPESLKRAMSERTPSSLWINLEYLSAEPWVEGCHRLPSPQMVGPDKYFFFPGFTEQTGGLLREADLITRREAFDKQQQTEFLKKLGVSRNADSTLISLFTYENAAIDSWLDSLSRAPDSTHLLVPRGRVESGVAAWLGVNRLETAEVYQRGSLVVQSIPFVTQIEYDQLLWSCDINFVRGEDSFVRAQWAGKPFIWHIYQQEELAHIDKLEAFLSHFLADADPVTANAIRDLWMAWNLEESLCESWNFWKLNSLAITELSATWCRQLSKQKSLAESLAEFAENW
ncbi:MAG: hypothetical protein RL143_1051 [Pseudomonadota bacterium]